MDQRRGGYTQEYWLHALVATATADSGEQVQILPDPLASEKLVPVARRLYDDTADVLASCSRIEERAKRTSSVGPTRVCVTGGQSAAFTDQRHGQ
jgi:hypothetical protein